MNRVEIIINMALEEDLFELIDQKNIERNYTKINNVHGEGFSEPKMGSAVWPEENVLFILYCGLDDTVLLKEIVLSLRKLHPDTGIQMFILPGVEVIN